MDGPEWAAGKLSEDHKDNRWSLLSADIREIEQRLDLLETVCEQCILEHQGRIV